MSNTPRTDGSVIVAMWKAEGGELVRADFARELEQELREARADAESWSQQADMHATDALQYARERDEARAEVARLREAIRDFVNGQSWAADTWKQARHIRPLFDIAGETK